MSGMIWVLIPLAAIFGWIFIEYQENKMKMMQNSDQNKEDVEKLQNQLKRLQKRIENLEAIAAEAPSDFTRNRDINYSEPDMNQSDSASENEMKVSDMAGKRKLKN